MYDEKNNFAFRFKQLREALRLNQGEIAAKTGVHLQTISRYERGELRPSGKKISALVQTVGVNPTWLLTGEGEMFIKPPKEKFPSETEDSVLLVLLDKVRKIYREGGQDAKIKLRGTIEVLHDDLLKTKEEFIPTGTGQKKGA